MYCAFTFPMFIRLGQAINTGAFTGGDNINLIHFVSPFLIEFLVTRV